MAAAAPSKAKSLFDESSDEGDEQRKLKINQHYAAEFETRKQREELRQAREQRDLDDDDDSDGSSSSSEDEDAELLTTKLDVNVFKTINAVRSKDSSIYDPNKRFFEENDPDTTNSEDENASKKRKPKLYKDVVREQILETIDKEEKGVADDNEDGDYRKPESMARLAYDEEQTKLRKAFLESTRSASDESDSETDNLLTRKRKRSATANEDDEQERRELELELRKLEASKGQASDIVDPKGEVKDGEQFLLNYFKSRTWMDKDNDESDSSNADSSEDDEQVPLKTSDTAAESGNTSDDSLEQLDRTDDFEAKYNFRFEEAAAEAERSGVDFSLQSYARGQTMNTLRRKDETRRDKRLARKERKDAERKAKEEQLRRLKNAKRQEMEEKLKQVKRVLGDIEGRGASVDEASLLKLIEGDFDPKKFEAIMNETYNDDFYQKEDAEWKSDKDVRASLEKDEEGVLLVGQDEEEGGLYDDIEELAEGDSNMNDEDLDDEYDDGYDGDWQADDEQDEQTETELEGKVKAKMMDALYKLDYEDIVAGIPTRFKYREVKPNNYGLSPEEILFARDATLKQYVSLKRLAPYQEDEYFIGSRKRRRFRDMLKHDLEEQLNNEAAPTDDKPVKGDADDVAVGKKKKRRRLKKGKKEVGDEPHAQLNVNVTDQDDTRVPSEPEADKPVELTDDKDFKKRSGGSAKDAKIEKQEKTDKTKRKKKRKHKKVNVEGISEARLAAYGL